MSSEGKCTNSHVRDGKAEAGEQDEWEGKSHMPENGLIQGTGNTGDDSIADAKQAGRQAKAGLKSGWMQEREELYFLNLLSRKYLYICSQKEN